MEAANRQRRFEFRNAENPSPIIAVIFQAVAYAYVLPDRPEFHLFRLSLHGDEENVEREDGGESSAVNNAPRVFLRLLLPTVRF